MLRRLPPDATADAVAALVHATLDARHIRAAVAYFEPGKIK